jgi:hypothetical protein
MNSIQIDFASQGCCAPKSGFLILVTVQVPCLNRTRRSTDLTSQKHRGRRDLRSFFWLYPTPLRFGDFPRESDAYAFYAYIPRAVYYPQVYLDADERGFSRNKTHFWGSEPKIELFSGSFRVFPRQSASYWVLKKMWVIDSRCYLLILFAV